MRRWVGLGRVRGANRVATVIRQIVVILEEEVRGDKSKSQCSIWGSECPLCWSLFQVLNQPNQIHTYLKPWSNPVM